MLLHAPPGEMLAYQTFRATEHDIVKLYSNWTDIPSPVSTVTIEAKDLKILGKWSLCLCPPKLSDETITVGTTQ